MSWLMRLLLLADVANVSFVVDAIVVAAGVVATDVVAAGVAATDVVAVGQERLRKMDESKGRKK